MLNKSFAHLLEMRLEKALIVSLPTTETPLLQMKNFQKKNHRQAKMYRLIATTSSYEKQKQTRPSEKSN
jgi:hypothetical protein